MNTVPLSAPGVYRIVDIETGRFYIGSSVNIAKRWRYHVYRFSMGNHPNPIMQAIWNSNHGRLRIETVQICCADKAEILRAEQSALDAAGVGTNRICMNVLPIAGSHLGRKRSAETCARLAAARRGKIASPEARAKMRAAKLGRKQSAEVRAAQSVRQRGKKLGYKRMSKPAIWARSLNDDQVRALRRRRHEGLSWRLLGIEFGLTPTTAKRVALSITYREIV